MPETTETETPAIETETATEETTPEVVEETPTSETGEATAAPDADAPKPPAVKAETKRAAKAAKADKLEVGDKVYLDGDESTEWTVGKHYSASILMVTRETSPGHYLGEHVNPNRLTKA